MKICSNGSFEVLFTSTISLVLVGGLYHPGSSRNLYWIAFILAIYAVSLFFSLSIYAIDYLDGNFTGKPLLGKPVTFRPEEIAEIKSENMSRPPRAKIILENGKSLLIKKPLWMKEISKADFVRQVRDRVARESTQK